MDRERVLKARDIFAAASEKADGERTTYVTAACGDDAEVYHHVAALLDAHDRDGSTT